MSMARRKTRLHRHALHFLFPHKGNGYHPHIFRTAGVTALLVLAIVLEGAYLGATKFVFPNTGFLASVLPGALVALTNDDRTAQGIGSVTEDPLLDSAAALAANDMAAKGYFAHVSPDGKSPWYWLDEVGYTYAYAGENLAVNFTDSKDVETAWMNSPTHRANIVKPEYTKIGIGVANGQYEGKDVTFVVQFFASPGAAAKAPVVAPAPTPSKTASGSIAAAPASEPANVLGAAVAPASVAAEAATSPTYTLIYVLGAIAGLLLILLIISFAVHASRGVVELLGGGIAVLVIFAILLAYNAMGLGGAVVNAPEYAPTGNTP